MTSAKDESGFTIQELLVVIMVSSLLVGFCLSAFLFVTRLFNSWDARRELSETVDNTLYVIASDIQRSRRIELVDDSTLVLDRGVGVRTQYRFNGLTVMRDSVPIIPESQVTIRVAMHRAGNSFALKVDVTGSRKDLQRHAQTTVTCSPGGKAEFINSLSVGG